MYAKITKDLLYEPPDDVVGDRTGVVLICPEDGQPDGPLLKVRLLDDDRIPYYEAEATDETLEELASWAGRDSGCTILQTQKAGAWVDTIS